LLLGATLAFLARCARSRVDLNSCCEMIVLPAELWLQVHSWLVSGTTFAEFVVNTRYFGEARVGALRIWLDKQVVGVRLAPFEGTEDELGVIMDSIKGMAYPFECGRDTNCVCSV
jgi:hypothetical protein